MGGVVPRVVSVPPGRIAGWLERFAERNGEPVLRLVDGELLLSAPNGVTARCRVPFAPLTDLDLVAHTVRERRVGVLLVRKGGYAVGVFHGPRLVTSKVGSRHVQGRTAAGGQSQQRFARRRENQARQAYAAAADTAARLLAPEVAALVALVPGGDRAAVESVLTDPRLAAVADLPREPLLAVPEPRHAVLAAAYDGFAAVRVELTDPPADPAT